MFGKFKNIFSFFTSKSKDKKLERFQELLKKDEEEFAPVDIVEDVFEEESSSIFSQVKKTPFGSSGGFIETQKTSLTPSSIVIVEILHELVNIVIASRRGVFLDIVLLRSYAYSDLKVIYERLVPYEEIEDDEDDGSREDFKGGEVAIENIITIISYDINYSLPTNMVIIENRYSDFKEITLQKGRFGTEKKINEMLLNSLSDETGYAKEDMTYSIAKKKKNIDKKKKKDLLDEEERFLVSFAEKNHYVALEKYLKEAKFSLKKLHSYKSSLYSSFRLQSRESKMRIHVVDTTAYLLSRERESEFEYEEYDVSQEYERLKDDAMEIEEVILSGSGDYYEMIKNTFMDENIRLRYWNYNYDLPNCIVRIEKDLYLDNHYANTISTAYYELFSTTVSPADRFGISAKHTLYEIMAANLIIMPFVLIGLTTAAGFGWDHYEKEQLKKLTEAAKKYTVLNKKKKTLKSQLTKEQEKIAKSKGRLKKVKDVLSRDFIVEDALILHEIAEKIPNDILLTSIEKVQVKTTVKRKTTERVVIKISGKCYMEKSLFLFMDALQIKGKKVYLMNLTDSKKTKFPEVEKENLGKILDFLEQSSRESVLAEQNSSLTQSPQLRLQDIKLEEMKVYYGDTLNNSFQLEIR